jgi:alpha-L-rhamnosidase
VVSTGFSLYNCLLLRELAEKTGLPAEKYRDNAEKIKNAMLSRWWDEEKASFAGGGMGAQAFALWLGLIPKAKRAAAAENMALELRRRRCRITTGNQLTQPLMEMLFEYGYADDAWEFLCREEYPSFGYMLQNEATTVWERFELKKNCGMNSHNHPMHASSYRFLYAELCGLRPTEASWRRFTARPRIPDALLSASATVETPLGDVTLRWVKRYGELHLYLTVPCGATADAYLPWGEERTLSEGFHHFSHPL